MSSRRELLALLGRGALASALWPLSGGCASEARSTPRGCVEPGTDAERTLAAFVETVVPGYASDPEGAPGALDACGLNVLLDPALPLAPLVGLLAMTLDGASRLAYGAAFHEMGWYAREQILAEVELDMPELTLAIRLARSAFYAAQHSDVAERWLGVLGPNLGYLDEGFSFVEPQADEMTDDGNLP